MVTLSKFLNSNPDNGIQFPTPKRHLSPRRGGPTAMPACRHPPLWGSVFVSGGFCVHGEIQHDSRFAATMLASVKVCGACTLSAQPCRIWKSIFQSMPIYPSQKLPKTFSNPAPFHNAIPRAQVGDPGGTTHILKPKPKTLSPGL